MWLAVCFVTLAAGAVLAEPVKGPAEPAGGAAQPAPRNTAASTIAVSQGAGKGTDASVHSTAEDIVRALQQKRPFNEVIPSAGALERRDRPAERRLMPEGSHQINRSGRIAFHDGWWTLATGVDGEAPLRLLPNATLESMMRSNLGADSAIEFAVSGEYTVFENENYLVVRWAARNAPPAKPSAPPPATGESVPPAASATGAPAVAPDAAAEDVLSLLQKQQPAQEVVSPAATGLAPVPRKRAGRALLTDGTPLVNRPGRLVREGAWWTFVFESDRPEHPEPPLKLLPNKSVELMVQASQRGTAGVVFVVSGEVTSFDDQNYLLARAAMRRVDLGNLRK
ncbi:MAG: hypothetical protein HY763_10000 [Planctomycetes bacterium]|nr:hypothetical protein [Planctomycetota bacterium]